MKSRLAKPSVGGTGGREGHLLFMNSKCVSSAGADSRFGQTFVEKNGLQVALLLARVLGTERNSAGEMMDLLAKSTELLICYVDRCWSAFSRRRWVGIRCSCYDSPFLTVSYRTVLIGTTGGNWSRFAGQDSSP